MRGNPAAARRRLWVLVGELGLDRDERLELATMALAVEIESWKDLSDEQVFRLCDVLDGYGYVAELLRQRV